MESINSKCVENLGENLKRARILAAMGLGMATIQTLGGSAGIGEKTICLGLSNILAELSNPSGDQDNPDFWIKVWGAPEGMASEQHIKISKAAAAAFTVRNNDERNLFGKDRYFRLMLPAVASEIERGRTKSTSLTEWLAILVSIEASLISGMMALKHLKTGSSQQSRTIH